MTQRLLCVACAALAAVVSACSGGTESTTTGPSAVSAERVDGLDAGDNTTGGLHRPSVPTNLRVTSQVKLAVELSWNAVAGATSYTVMVGGTPGGTDTFFNDTTGPRSGSRQRTASSTRACRPTTPAAAARPPGRSSTSFRSPKGYPTRVFQRVGVFQPQRVVNTRWAPSSDSTSLTARLP